VLVNYLTAANDMIAHPAPTEAFGRLLAFVDGLIGKAEQH